MPWSLTIGRLFGSEIRVHVTFLLLLLWIGVSAYQDGGQAAAIEGVAFILAIFACVVAHEFGHALAARRYGIATPDITLLPIGGVARLERMPERPREEIVVALAGPAVNVVIAAVLFLVLGARFDAASVAALDDPAAGFLARVATVNVFLVLFNLIPAFPMDGGRVLRALLAIRYDRATATRYAARAGQVLAFGFGFWGLTTGNVFLVFIAVFVYLAAAGESYQVGMEDAGRTVSAREAMITRFETLGPQATLANAAEALIRTTQHEFPVVDGAGQLRGILTQKALIQALARTGRDTPVVEVMVRDVPTIRENAALSFAMNRMREQDAPALGVVDRDGRLVAYITPENIAEYMLLAQAGGVGRRRPSLAGNGPFDPPRNG
ncbi:site-2 protease family protein [Aurantimonas sp. HBX-1]|uniref:site-2 protease family protein n=1 Tax=Aurantimonas sp. HBX-1 TaxID=2906072 RepID=UPI001F45EF4F|nr:site-2 protease family protein [Aurantimonas sp. HBX-1]UIJ71975.1 site-2 protease family protein [Aurantimonas sp. HBX-1]